MSRVSWVEMSPSLFAEGSCPQLSARGVSSAVGKVRAAQPWPGNWCAWLCCDAGFNATSLPRMASLPSRGAVARPHPDEAGTIGGARFPSHEGWWLMCRDGSSDVTGPVSMWWSRTGAQAPPLCKSHWIWGRAPAPAWVLGQVLGGKGSGWGEHPVLEWRSSLLSGWAVVPSQHVPVPCPLVGGTRTKPGLRSCKMHPGIWDGAVGLVSVQ